jgi:hypothetical protein
MRAAVLLALVATPALAEIGIVPTPSGLARIEGERLGEGEALWVGEAEVIPGDGVSVLWIEEQVRDLLLVGRSDGGTLCAAEWMWVHTERGGLRASEPFGTCSDLLTVTDGPVGVTVSMPSHDADWPVVDFVYDGVAVREVPQGQRRSGSPPEAGALAWVGRHPWELFRASDWRGPLVALLGKEGYREAQEAIGSARPMEAEGDWVAGRGCMANGCGAAWGAVAIHRGDGRLLVALGGWEREPRLWGDPKGPLPPTVAEVMAGRD